MFHACFCLGAEKSQASEWEKKKCNCFLQLFTDYCRTSTTPAPTTGMHSCLHTCGSYTVTAVPTPSAGNTDRTALFTLDYYSGIFRIRMWKLPVSHWHLHQPQPPRLLLQLGLLYLAAQSTIWPKSLPVLHIRGVSKSRTGTTNPAWWREDTDCFLFFNFFFKPD